MRPSFGDVFCLDRAQRVELKELEILDKRYGQPAS